MRVYYPKPAVTLRNNFEVKYAGLNQQSVLWSTYSFPSMPRLLPLSLLSLPFPPCCTPWSLYSTFNIFGSGFPPPPSHLSGGFAAKLLTMSQLINKAIEFCQHTSETALLAKATIQVDISKQSTDQFITNVGRRSLIESGISLINEAQKYFQQANDDES